MDQTASPGSGWHPICFPETYGRYYFKLSHGHLVTNYGVHDLDNATAAQIAAIELARSIRQERPELVGQRYSVSATDEFGVDLCIIPIEIP